MHHFKFCDFPLLTSWTVLSATLPRDPFGMTCLWQGLALREESLNLVLSHSQTCTRFMCFLSFCPTVLHIFPTLPPHPIYYSDPFFLCLGTSVFNHPSASPSNLTLGLQCEPVSQRHFIALVMPYFFASVCSNLISFLLFLQDFGL